MRILKILLFTVFFMGANYAQADESVWVSADHVQAKLISSGDDIAVQIRMIKGWHTYWRVPGDAGLPPRFDWSESENIAGVGIQWPAPERFEEFGLYTFGYKDEITFPAHVQFKEYKHPAHFRLKLDVMVCKDICIPQNLELEIALSDETLPSAQKMIDFARRKVPAADETPSLKIDTVVAGPDALVLSAFSKRGFESIDVFAHVDDFAFTSPPEITVDDKDKHKALIKIPKPGDIEDLNEYLAGKALNITLVSGSGAIEKTVEF